jgi:hypothetical protein
VSARFQATQPYLATLFAAVRNGAFLTRARLRLWAVAFLIGYAVAIAVLFATAHGLNDYAGRPLGTDFSDVYVAGKQALHGHAAAPFDPATQRAAERAMFGSGTQFYGWHYPPYFLLIAAPLAAMPYLPALAVWQIASALAYLGALWLLLRNGPLPALARDRLWPLLALGFSAVFVNLTHGHNGFLTAALFAGGLALLDRRPVVAGILFGLLAYKPQFGVLLPLALIAAGRWRTIASATATVAALTLAVTLIFGWQVWPAFLESSHFTRTVVLEQGGTGFHKIQSVFAWTRLWGGSVALAYAMQAIVSLLSAAGIVALWRSDTSFANKAAALCFAAVLATPYSLDYDLMILAPALALLTAQGLKQGFAPWRTSLLALLWLVPIAARGIAEAILLPVGVILVLAGFAALCTEGLQRRICPASQAV